MAVKIGDVTIRIGASTTELEKDLRKAERALQATAQKFNRIGQDLTIGLTAPLAAFGVAATASFADFERLSKSLEAVMGDAEAAAVEFEKLRKVAEAPGLALPQVVSASAKLQAVGLSADDARKTIAEFGNAVARSGGGAQEFDGAVLALTQIASKGKISAEEINQLGERIFEIRPALQAAFGTANSEELQKLGISAEEFIAKTTAELSKLQRVEGGLSNSFENFRDSITGSLSALGESISKAIDLPNLLDRISSSINDAVTAFRGLSPEVQKFLVIGAGIVASLGPAILIFGKIQLAVGTLQVAFVRLSALLASGGGLGAAFAALTGPVAIAIAAIAASVYLIYKNWELVKKSLVGVINYFIDLYNESILVRAAVEYIILTFKNLAAAVKLVVNLSINILKGLFKFIIDNFKNAGALIKAVLTADFKAVPGIISNAYKTAFSNVKELATDSLDDIKEYGSSVGDNIANAVNSTLRNKKIEGITADDIFGSDQEAEVKDRVNNAVAGLGEFDRNAKTKPTKPTKRTELDTSTLDQTIEKFNEARQQLNENIQAAVGKQKAFKDIQDIETRLLEAAKKKLPPLELKVQADTSSIGNFTETLKSKAAGLVEKFEGIASTASSLGNSFFNTLNKGFDNREQRLDDYYNKEKSNIENSLLTEQQKSEQIAALDERTNQQRKRIARDRAKAEKAQAIFSATINGALATLKAFVEGGPILAAITGALVAAQIAAIAAQPLPSLNVGTDLVKKSGIAMIHKGEAIVPANVVKGGFTGGGNQLTGRLSGIDILISAKNSERYLNRIG